MFYPNKAIQELVGYANMIYLLDPHKAQPQTNDVFTFKSIVISWCLTKQTSVAISSKNVELLALLEVSKERIWLRSVAQHIRGIWGLFLNEKPIVLYEDNVECLVQL